MALISFDTVMMACASQELQRSVTGAKVERIAQPNAYETLWTLFTRGSKLTLLIDTDASSSRIHLTKRARSSPPNPPAFCMLLRKLLNGAHFEGIEHPLGFGERVARLVFASYDGRRYGLYVELMGRHSNQILVNEDGIILGAIKRVTNTMSRVREVRPGIPYVLPPRQRGARRDIFSPVAGNDLPNLSFDDEAGAEAWIAKTFTGVSPLMSREGIARRPQPEFNTESIWYGLNNLINYVRLADYSPTLITDTLGRPTGAYPVLLRTVPPVQQPMADTFSIALDTAADSLEQHDTFDSERMALISALRRAKRICEKEILDCQEGLANSERALEYRTAGELIMANQIKIKAGDELTVLLDYATGEDREIDLDPALSAPANAELYFKRYHKAQAAKERLEQRFEEVERRLDRIEEALPKAAEASSIDTVQALGQSLEDIREVTDNTSSEGTGESAPAQPANPYPGYKVRTFRSVDGWEILVGENAESNDYITTKVAAPSDIWLHARAQTSAHAIIRTRNRPAAVSSAALRCAAEQVAKRSTAKHSRLVPVDYTLRKHVRKPRGSKPGQVIYSREKTLDVSPEVAVNG